MPENDSQQNDSQQEQEIKHIDDYIINQKMALKKVALRYGGRAHIAIQHNMLWQRMGNTFKLRNVFKSHVVRNVYKSHAYPIAWRGICSILAIEWIKEHIRGGDFVKDIRRFTSVLERKEKWSEKDKIFAKDINPSLSDIKTFDFALRKFCKFEDQSYYDASTRKYAYASFEPNQYQILLFKRHAMASCVHEDWTFDFFDPDIGQVVGAISAKLVEDYLNSCGVLRSELIVRAYVPRFNSLRRASKYPGKKKIAFL